MCDTLIALPGTTASVHLLFGKNSDREPNEAQAIQRIPAQRHEEKALKCTYIEVPQVEETYEVLLSRPFHMWGAEMGANEHGVVIGNEAVFTRIKMPHRNTGLTGMDLLRLALERSRTSEEALYCITELLEEYGQNACGGYKNKKFFYHNSFLIGDPEAAWLLETAGRHWVAGKVGQICSISNGLTIGREYDRISEHAVDYAYRRRWLRDNEPFNFQKAYSEWFMTRMSACSIRRRTTGEALKQEIGALTVEKFIDILSSHETLRKPFEPHRSTTASVCMHATGLTNPNQTTGSMIAAIRKNSRATIWMTGASMPCLSIYLPFFFGGDSLMGEYWDLPGSREDDSMWWQAEHLHRRIGKNYRKGRELIEKERQEFQQALLEEEARLIRERAGAEELDAFSHRALSEYRRLLSDWTSRVQDSTLRRRSRNPLYWLYEKRRDKKAGLQ